MTQLQLEWLRSTRRSRSLIDTQMWSGHTFLLWWAAHPLSTSNDPSDMFARINYVSIYLPLVKCWRLNFDINNFIVANWLFFDRFTWSMQLNGAKFTLAIAHSNCRIVQVLWIAMKMKSTVFGCIQGASLSISLSLFLSIFLLFCHP